jgi:hypothetical protein
LRCGARLVTGCRISRRSRCPSSKALYLAESARLGTPGRIERHEDLSLLFIDDDPDRAWAELGPYFLREASEYALWAREGVERRYEAHVTTIDDLRSQRVYEILTPEQCLERARARPGVYKPILHPLAGGIPVSRAQDCLRLFADRVLAPLRARGLNRRHPARASLLRALAGIARVDPRRFSRRIASS